MGPYLTPSALFGFGPWGSAVARDVAEELKERSPELVPACPVLALEGESPDMRELVRAHLRAGRMAEGIRALVQEGLVVLDPVLAPPTCLYLVVSLEDDPELTLLQQVVSMAAEAASELKIRLTPAAVVDMGQARQLPALDPVFPLYVIEPVTSHGLVIEAAEYHEAAVEILLAALQPGGSQVLAAGRGMGTIGISWLQSYPRGLQESLVQRLSRDGLTRCLEPCATAGGAEPDPISGRADALLSGLPFQWSEPGGLRAERPLFGRIHRQQKAQHLRRCIAVLQRRLGRWETMLARNEARQAEVEAALLHQQVEATLASGPGCMAKAALLCEGVAREAGRREYGAPAQVPVSPGSALRQLQRAEALPQVTPVSLAVILVLALLTLLRFALKWPWAPLMPWMTLLASVPVVYMGWRTWWIGRTAEKGRQAVLQHATAAAEGLLIQRMEALDQALAEDATEFALQLAQAAEELRRRCRAEPGAAALPARSGRALSAPLLAGTAAEQTYRERHVRTADLARMLADSGCLGLWRDTEALLARVESTTREYLKTLPVPDPADLVTRAHGPDLAQRLQTAVQGMLDWSQPLCARSVLSVQEADRYLLWPDNLPIPSLPPEVQVLSGSRSCMAMVTVVRGLPATARQRRVGSETA